MTIQKQSPISAGSFAWRFAIAFAALGAAPPAWSASACVVCISNPFLDYENQGVNSLGFNTGVYLRVGANSVTPNGAAGTTGTASTVNTVTGATFSTAINFNPGPNIPNFFSRYMAVNPALLGPYTMTFRNGSDSASAVVSMPAGAGVAPFVQSITLSGTSANPTFSWSPPPGTVVNGYRINFYDKSLVSPTNNGQVASINLQPSVTSHTVTAADFSLPGYAFTLGKAYSIEIGLMQTKDGTSNNLSNANLASISRTYADFTPNAGGGPPVNLPVVLVNGSFQFNMAVQPNQMYFIDPAVATGYDYATGAGDPNFASVTLPTNVSGAFKLYTRDANGQLVFVSALVGGQRYDFGAGGVSFFEVTGIDPANGLDPGSTTAFVTGLTFVAAGAFTGTQTPLVTQLADVPLPTTLALMAIAPLLWLMRSRRKVAGGKAR